MINNLFDNNHTEVKTKRKTILLVDFSAIAHATFHVCRLDPSVNSEDDLLSIWRHTILTSLLTRKNKICPDEVVLCLDYGSWRGDYFKYYKAKRKADKSSSDVDYNFFFEASNQFISEIKEFFPWLVIQHKKCEGDDVIAILAYELSKDSNVIVCTSDKDLKQLLEIDNVTYYSYRKDCFETLDNPKEFLLRQILFGDTSDGIPNVKSPDNCFVAKIKQTPCGPKTIDKILINGVKEFIVENNLIKNFKRNKTLIELSKITIPEDLWKSVLTLYNNYNRIEPDYIKMLGFMNKNNLIKLRERVNEFM